MPNLQLKLVHKFEMVAALPLVACAIILLILGGIYTYSDSQIAEAQRAREVMDSCEYIQRTLTHATAKLWVTKSQEYDAEGSILVRTRNKMSEKISRLKELCEGHPDEYATVLKIEAAVQSSLEYMKKSTVMKTEQGMATALKIIGFQSITREQSEQLEHLNQQLANQLGSRLSGENPQSIEEGMAVYIIFATISIIALSAVSAILLNRNVVSRLSKLSANSERLAKLDTLAAPTSGDDELAELDKTFYTMATSLAEAIARERATIEHAADVICRLDSRGTILSTNDACEQSWDYSPAQLVSQNLLDIVHPDDRLHMKNELARVLNSSETITFESRMLSKKGKLLHILWSCRADVEQKEIFTVAHDITDRKLAQENLTQSEERFETIKQKTPAGIVLLNAQGKILDVNPAATAMIGRSESDLLESSVQELIPEFKVNALNMVQLREHQILQPDGKVKTADIIFDHLQNDNRELISVLLDTTERHELERLKETLVAMIAHDIATPMTTIHSQLHLAQVGAMGTLSEDGTKQVNIAESQSVELMNLLTTIMKTAKYKQSTILNGISKTSLEELVESVVESTSFEREARSIDVHLQIDRSIQLMAEPDSLGHAIKVVLAQLIRTCPDRNAITFETMHNEDDERQSGFITLRMSHPTSSSTPLATSLTWEFATAIVGANSGALKYIDAQRFVACDFELKVAT